MPPIVHAVTGKGGVGKTSVACALALAYAQAGCRVLLAEMDGGDRAARALDVPALGYPMREALPGLWLTDLTPQETLKEYVLLIIRLEAVYRMVFENRLVRSFLRLLPALGELTMLGKVWYEWQLPHASVPRAHKFDVIVMDLPATGHAQALLAAPRAVMASVPAGPMRENALRIEHMLHDARSSLLFVTTPDDTPVAESEELWQFATERQYKRMHVIANRCVPPLPPTSLEAARQLSEQPSGSCAVDFSSLAHVLSLRDARARAGEAHLARLQQSTDSQQPMVRLAQAPKPLTRHELLAMGTALAPIWQASLADVSPRPPRPAARAHERSPLAARSER